MKSISKSAGFISRSFHSSISLLRPSFAKVIASKVPGMVPSISHNLVPSRFMSDVPGVQTGGDKLVLMYTCKVCDTRSARKISKQAYKTGVVIVRCGSCQSKHLIADNMGVFEDAGWNVHDFLSGKGENSKYMTEENVFELNVDDIVGKDDQGT